MTYSWRNFKGKQVDFGNIDHQYLSNIIWYCQIIFQSDEDFILYLLDILSERFNGQILPYRPHIKFKYEINRLKELGYLTYDHTGLGIISYQGKQIGEIRTFSL